MVIGDAVGDARWKGSSPEALEWLGRTLVEEGVDLLAAEQSQLGRGTPVYAHHDADVIEIQRLMALNHIRMLPIVEDGCVVGIIDILELAQRDDLAPDDPIEKAVS